MCTVLITSDILSASLSQVKELRGMILLCEIHCIGVEVTLYQIIMRNPLYSYLTYFEHELESGEAV